MSCKYTLRFAPDSLGEYKDFIVVETQAEDLLVVPVEAWRPPPVLTCEFINKCLLFLNTTLYFFLLFFAAVLLSTKSSGVWLLSDRRG